MADKPNKEDLDLIAGAFLAFAAMMKDYRVSKKYAVKAMALAYDMNSQPQSEAKDG